MSIPEDGTALQFHYELNPGTKQGKRDGEEGMENPMGELEGGKEEKKDGFAVEQVEVYFWAVHPNWGNLAVNLTSPSGTVSRLALAHAQNVSYDDMTNSHGFFYFFIFLFFYFFIFLFFYFFYFFIFYFLFFYFFFLIWF